MGPRIGSDAGGERLSFLPVGGYDRDIPSDTDSDECNDEKELLTPPDAESFEESLRKMSGPLSSDRWSKEDEANERLHSQRAANNRAIRDRLNDLNQHLNRAN